MTDFFRDDAHFKRIHPKSAIETEKTPHFSGRTTLPIWISSQKHRYMLRAHTFGIVAYRISKETIYVFAPLGRV